MSILSINPKEVSVGKFHNYILSSIAPRPIAFVSSIDSEGNVNLSPFSFFNAFGANPPLLVFSPARRVRNNHIKHTLENVKEVPEVVINIINYSMVEQMSLASTEYDKGVNEFIKAGFEEEASSMVKPPRVKGIPASFECKVRDVIQTGLDGGAGNLVICEIILAHFQENILDKEQKIDPFKFDHVARMGGDWYARIDEDSMFDIPKPKSRIGMGIDQMPEYIRHSKYLTGNNLGRLGTIEKLPDEKEVKDYSTSADIQKIRTRFANDADSMERHFYLLAKKYLVRNEVERSWLVLLQLNK